jgi:hypothetical protein
MVRLRHDLDKGVDDQGDSMNTNFRLAALGAGIALGIGTMTAMAQVAPEAEALPTPDPVQVTDTIEVPDIEVAPEPPAEVEVTPAPEEAPDYVDPIDGSEWNWEDLDSGEGGPDNWQPEDSICEGTADSHTCISEEPSMVVDDEWDCRVDPNSYCTVEVNGTWYALDFTTMTFSELH